MLIAAYVVQSYTQLVPNRINIWQNSKCHQSFGKILSLIFPLLYSNHICKIIGAPPATPPLSNIRGTSERISIFNIHQKGGVASPRFSQHTLSANPHPPPPPFSQAKTTGETKWKVQYWNQHQKLSTFRPFVTISALKRQYREKNLVCFVDGELQEILTNDRLLRLHFCRIFPQDPMMILLLPANC